jgi:hypothetical protein
VNTVQFQDHLGAIVRFNALCDPNANRTSTLPQKANTLSLG